MKNVGTAVLVFLLLLFFFWMLGQSIDRQAQIDDKKHAKRMQEQRSGR